MLQPISVVGGSYQDKSIQFDAQRTVNLYPVMSESGKAKSIAKLASVTGKTAYLTLGGGPIRGQREAAGRWFVVSGTTLYEIVAGAAVSRGTISGSDPVVMSDNGIQLAIANGSLHILTLADNTLVSVAGTSTDWVDYLDGYFVLGTSVSGRFAITAGYDGTSINGLDFATAEGNPDGLVRGFVDHRELILFGTKSIEFWYNSGAASFPIERIGGGYTEHGCIAGRSVAKMDNSVFFLGRDHNGSGIVYRIQNYSAVRVSTNAVETAIAPHDLANATGFAYQIEGHSFYQLNVPGADTSWVYDAATNMWHERGFWNPATGAYELDLATNHLYVNSKHYVGDRRNGTLYEMTGYSDGEYALRRMRRTPHGHADGLRIIFDNVEVDMEVGVGLTSGQGSDPLLMMRSSKDGGHTWSNERTGSMGKIGEYTRRVNFSCCGQSRDRVFEFAVSDPVEATFIDARASIRVCAS